MSRESSLASSLKAGVISDCPLQRKYFSELLGRYGLQVAVCCEPRLLEFQSDQRLAELACWIVDLADECSPDAVMERLEQFDQPILFGPGRPPAGQEDGYLAWERRMIGKLESFLGQLAQPESQATVAALSDQAAAMPARSERAPVSNAAANEVWILVASLGGPAAVKQFLDALPVIVPVGFYYVQHVDDTAARVLSQVLARHSTVSMKPATAGSVLHNGEVLMVPVTHQIRISDFGVVTNDEPWIGPYAPSIDQFLAHAFSYYGTRCHVIVFSGMGNDGAGTIPRMKQAGCQVWTQSPQSCANASMPQSVLDLGCSDFSGSPQELAQALTKRFS